MPRRQLLDTPAWTAPGALRACAWIACVALVGLAGGSDAGSSEPHPLADESGPAETVKVQDLAFRVPEAWESQPVQSQMRAAQYVLPGEAGEASLVLFRFPGGGSARANVDRWIGQIQNPTSGPEVAEQKRDGLTLTTLDVTGGFLGQQMPGAPAQPPIESARMLALVVEGEGSPYFFKLLGPAETVSAWAVDWQALVESVQQD